MALVKPGYHLPYCPIFRRPLSHVVFRTRQQQQSHFYSTDDYGLTFLLRHVQNGPEEVNSKQITSFTGTIPISTHLPQEQRLLHRRCRRTFLDGARSLNAVGESRETFEEVVEGD